MNWLFFGCFLWTVDLLRMTLSYQHCDVASIHRWWLMCQSCNTCCRVDTLPPWLPGPHPLASSTDVATPDVFASLHCRNQPEMQSLLLMLCKSLFSLPTTGCGGRNQDQVATCRTAYQPTATFSLSCSQLELFRWRKTDLKGTVKKKQLMTCSEVNGKPTTLRGHNALASNNLKRSQIAFFSIFQLFYALFFF